MHSVDAEHPGQRGIRGDMVAPVLIVLCILCIYGQTLGFSYAGDDFLTVVHHPAIGRGGGLGPLLRTDALGVPLGAGASIYRPVTGLSYLIDWRLGRGAPWLLHLTNLGLYAAVCLLVRRFAARWLGSSGALCAALVFAVMPMHVEVVASVTGRSDLLCLLFGLAALEVALPLEQGPGPGSGPPGDGRERPASVSWWAACAAACLFALSLLSKEASILLPLISAWLIGQHLRTGVGARAGTALRASLPALLMALPVAGYFAFRARFLTSAGDLAQGGRYILALNNPLNDPQVGLPARLWTGLHVLGHYAVLTVVPYEMPIDYSYSATVAHVPPGDPLCWLGLALLVLSAGVAVSGLFRLGATSAWCGALIGSYLPVSNWIVPIGAIEASRFFFFPSLWCALGAGLLWQRLSSRVCAPLLLGGTALLLCVNGLLGGRFTRCWHDSDVRAVCAMASRPDSENAQLWMAHRAYFHRDLPQGLWYAAVHSATMHHYPQPFSVPVRVHELPIAERLAHLTELLDIREPRSVFLARLEVYIREVMGRRELADFTRHVRLFPVTSTEDVR